jgi:hypothetical protein
MHGACSRIVGACVLVALLAACHGGAAGRLGSTPAKLDVKAACAALDGVQRSSDALNGVDVADPEASLIALDKAVNTYATALVGFALVGPPSLRTDVAKLRADVIGRRFTQAAAARAPIDAWAATHCG